MRPIDADALNRTLQERVGSPTDDRLYEVNLCIIEAPTLKVPSEDWISRQRLKDEIRYYIDEAGWGDEINTGLGWCLEFIDNQAPVKWE